jgi:5-methyltetrahydropteroyltriglutamate--homocysteine methyltransferase
MVEANLTGIFPRSEELVQATRAGVRGKIAPADLESVFRRDLAALVQLQNDCGLDYVVDGQLNWQDLFRPFSTMFTGITLGSLTRWFDNNAFYRKPIIVDKIRPSKSNIQQYFQSNQLRASAPKKAILPGPFTLAAMSQNSAYGSLAELVDDIAHALKEYVSELRKAGYSYVQFDEPSLCENGRTKSELEIGHHAFEICARGMGVKTRLQTYFGDVGPVIDSLLNYPVDCVGVDFYATSVDAMREYSFSKELGCGCIDGRNSLLESPEELTGFVKRVRSDLEPKSLSICPNSDLQFLPYSIAEKKVRVLAAAKKRLEA